MVREPTPTGISPGMKRWLNDQAQHGWVMPTASWWKRLPLIRYMRAARFDHLIHHLQAEYYINGVGDGMPGQRDLWLVYGIAKGKERAYG